MTNRFGAMLMTTALLTACSSGVKVQTTPVESDPQREVYLRGVFNWWEAIEQNKLQEVNSQPGLWKTTTVEPLIADGQPYEWKFVDADWTCGSNYGYLGSSSSIEVEQIVLLDNCSAFNNLKFTPTKDGYYDFYLDLRDPNQAKTYIEHAGNH